MQPSSPEIKRETKLSDLPRELARLIVKEAQPKVVCAIKEGIHEVEYIIKSGKKIKLNRWFPSRYFLVKNEEWPDYIADKAEAIGQFFNAPPNAGEEYCLTLASNDTHFTFFEATYEEDNIVVTIGHHYENMENEDDMCTVYFNRYKYRAALETMVRDMHRRIKKANPPKITNLPANL